MFSDPDKRTRVKICGITTLEDARFISGALADFIGFIFFEDSPRYVDPSRAGAIANWIEGPQKVGVFVNQPLDEVNEIAKRTGMDLVQLHGNESPEYCSMIQLPIIKVFHISDETDPEQLKVKLEEYADLAEYYLFDTKLEEKWGGTGKTFDWTLLENEITEVPTILSGGLNDENIEEAIRRVDPFAVDLSSSLEEAPGLKDFEKVEHFFEKMRQIWDSQEESQF